MDTAVATTTAALLEVRSCRQAYHKDANADLVVLDDVNLTLREGEMVALLGRSGSGKSTLLRIVSGLLEPTAGEVLWCGAPVWAGRGRRHGVPELRAVPLADRAGERRARPGSARRGAGRARQAGGAGDRPDWTGRVRERLPEGAVRRHASARRAGAGAGGASRPAADGRAVQCAGRVDCGNPAHRPDRPVVGRPPAGEGGADGDAQHRGGGADVRPHPGVLVQPGAGGQRTGGASCRIRATGWTRCSASWWTTSTA